MFGRKENNKITLKVQNGLTSKEFVDFVKTVNKVAIAFPNVTVCVELEGGFVESTEESNNGNNQSKCTDDAGI